MKYLTNILDDAKTLPGKVKMAGIAALVSVTTATANVTQSSQMISDPQTQDYYAGFLRECNNLHQVIPVIVGGVALWGVLDYFRRKCPKCKKEYGLEHQYTENTVKGWAKLIIKNDVDTYKCKSCGHVVKKTSNRE